MARCPHGFERAVVPCSVCSSRERSAARGGPTASPDAPRRGRPTKYSSGQTIAGARIVSRAENQGNGNAAWLCVLACGHEKIVQGIALRAAEKARSTVRCSEGCPKQAVTAAPREALK
jgi:hypothetical protein